MRCVNHIKALDSNLKTQTSFKAHDFVMITLSTSWSWGNVNPLTRFLGWANFPCERLNDKYFRLLQATYGLC